MNNRVHDRDAAPGVLLAIDSASEQAGLALFDGNVVSELSWPAGRSQTTSLLVEIHHLLSRQDLSPSDLAGVAVAIGPGTFTGLRVGLSVAKGLVLGLGIPIIGIPTLAAAALPLAVCNDVVVPLLPAGRGRIVWSVYEPSDGRLIEREPVRNGTIDELATALPTNGPIVVTGELTPEQAAHLESVPGVRLPPRALRARRAGAVATLAWNRLSNNDVDDPADLHPIYAGR